MPVLELDDWIADVYQAVFMSSKDRFEELLARAGALRAEGIRGRYAPSPTGTLHLGNVRTALVAWLQVRLQQGTLVMRMEDIDLPRVIEGSAEEVLEDLRWVGLDWDEGPDVGGPLGPYDQSTRTELYEEALRRLEEKGLIFRCYCSRKDVAEAASAPHGLGGVITYPGTCRTLTTEEEAAVRREKPDRDPAWRYRIPSRHVSLVDEVVGRYEENLETEVGDFVVRRADLIFAYQLAVVVDDALMGITDIVRGFDLLDSTPRQIDLFEALDFPVPRFWHIPLMLDETGQRLSKRDGSESLRMLRDQGLT
ncbi:MAG: tRNA glutamyl-Q(34) synthetase GluQRS, partial [Bradymonadaceae bacterium]